MKTNTTINTVPALTLTEAVTVTVDEVKTNGQFTAHDITTAVRAGVNAGEFTLPGLEADPNTDGIKYWVHHEDIKEILRTLRNNGELANMGLTGVTEGVGVQFRTYVFANSVPGVMTTPATPVAVTTAAPAAPVVTQGPVEQKIQAYLANVGTATMKQIQSALKINGITCQDLAGMVSDLGFTVTPGTVGCFSTYIVT